MEAQKGLKDDGLALGVIQPYAEEKHRLLTYYANLFASSIRGKWDSLVYLDLYSGPGHAKIDGTNRIVATSPILVLELKNKFDRYIFCDSNPGNIAALTSRIAKQFSSLETRFVEGDINDKTDEVIKELPIPRRGHSVLGFCFLDPYKMNNLRFLTIRHLSQRYMDFLVLIPSGMDAKRAEQYYVQETNDTVALFLDNKKWREKWNEEKRRNKDFGDFIVEEFTNSMSSLGYRGTELVDTKPVKNEKNVIVYRLAFYSKDDLGMRLFRDSKKYSDPQMDMFNC